MTLTRVIGKSAAWIVGILAVLIAALVVFILTFDWNRARPYINERVSAEIGRSFAIQGELKVGWRRPDGETGWRAWVPWPSFTANDIAIGNPGWTRSPHFATLDSAHFDLAVLPLLAHRVVIPSIDLVNPAIDIERLADGRNNWACSIKQSGQPSTWQVELHNFGFAKGNVTYRDAITKADLNVAIDTLGQPIPLGDVLKQQEATSRAASAQSVGKAGAAQLTKKIEAASAASAASAAQAGAGASAASGASSAAGAASPSAVSGVAASSAASPASTASATAARPPAPTYAFGLVVKGRYKSVPIDGTGKIGGVLALRDATRSFPLQADVKAGDTRLAIVGTLTDPMQLAAIDLRLWLKGASMSHLYALTGVTLPDTPPYAT
ncbi:MAG: hypothetical protein GAK41_00436 [Burkholderia gladioli]|nr:MAG: hypothetical protein GAK41_00436 [Burkholderia gladioli]